MAAISGQPAPKPKALPKTERDEVEELLSQFEAPEPDPEAVETADLVGQTINEVAAPKPTVSPEPSLMQKAGNAAMTGLDVAGRVLDYPGGLARTAIAAQAGGAPHSLYDSTYEMSEKMAEPNRIVTKDDVVNALKGNAPLSAEYLKRMGVGEGGAIKVPKIGSVSTRDAAGFALDMLSDPLSAIAKLTKQAPYLKKVLNSPGLASEAVGEAIYKSGLKHVDAKLIEKGQDAVSPILLQEGARGTTEQIAKSVDEMSSAMGKVRQELYNRASAKGVTIDLGYPMKRAEAVIKSMRKDPGLAPAADELESMLARYKQVGKVSIDDVSEFKTNLYDALPASAFDAHGKLRGRAAHFKQALASDLRDVIAKAGNAAEPGLGDSINVLNEKWGTLLSAKKPLAQQAKQAQGKGIGSWIDGVILGAGYVNPEVAVGALGGKKALELANTTYMRTLIGKKLHDAGKVGLIDDLARRSLIDAAKLNRPDEEEIKPPLKAKEKKK